MSHLKRSLLILAVILIFSKLVLAEDGILVVSITNPRGQPIPGVVITTKGDSSTGAPTSRVGQLDTALSSDAGKTRIKLAPGTKPNTEVALMIVKPSELVFVSPWDGRIRIPPFDNESQNFVSVILIEAGDRAWLEYGVVTLALVSKINAANGSKLPKDKKPAEQRADNLAEEAKSYGFEPEEVDRAIRTLGETSKDPYELGQVALYERDYPEAERQLLLSKESRKKNLEKAQREYADVNFSLGQTYYEQGKYKDAVEAYQAAATARPSDSKTLAALAKVLDITGNPIQAEALLRRALALDEEEFGPDDFRTMDRVLALGIFFNNQDNFEQCELNLKRAISFCEKHCDPKYSEIGYLLNMLAVLYLMHHREVEAEVLLRRALTIQERALGLDHPKTAFSLNTLGLVYYNQGKDVEAEQTIKKALAIIWKAIEENTDPKADVSDLASNLNNGLGHLVLVYIRQKRYAEAEPLSRIRLRLDEHSWGALNPRLVFSLDALANVYQLENKYDEAEALYKRSLSILENALGSEHPQLYPALYHLATLYEKQGRYDEAEAQFRRAVTIHEKASAVKPNELATMIIGLADFYARQKKYTEAESLFNRTVAVTKDAGKTEYSTRVSVLTKLAEVYLRQGKTREAEVSFRRCITIIENLSLPKFSDLDSAFTNLANFYVNQKRFAKAERLYRRLLSAVETNLGKEDTNIGVVSIKLATVYREEAKYDKAELFYKSAIEFWEKKYGPDYHAITGGLEEYAILLRKTNRNFEAVKVETRAKAIKDNKSSTEPLKTP